MQSDVTLVGYRKWRISESFTCCLDIISQISQFSMVKILKVGKVPHMQQRVPILIYGLG